MISKVLGNATQGLPPLVGVVGGIAIYSSAGELWWLPALIFFGSLGPLLIGKKIVGKTPRLGCGLLELWVASSVSLIALSTMLVLWLTVNASDFIGGDENRQQAISGALVGAVTAYLAILWVKDIQESKGPFWTGTQVKAAIQHSFKDAPRAPAADTLEWEAVWAERVRNNGPSGWSLAARWGRCNILARYLRKKASNPAAEPGGPAAG